MKLLKITQSKIDNLGRRALTLFNGKNNTVTAVQYGPYGEDSSPVKNSIGHYSATEFDGDEVCLGTMNNNAKAEPGERRLYCTDENGAFKFNIWLRADGTVLAGGRDVPAQYTNFATKYNESKAELDALKASHNELAQKWNAFCAAYIPGGPSTPGAPATLTSSTVQPNTSNFANIKNEKFKTN